MGLLLWSLETLKSPLNEFPDKIKLAVMNNIDMIISSRTIISRNRSSTIYQLK